LASSEVKGLGFRFFRKRSAELILAKNDQNQGLKDQLNEIRKNREEIAVVLAGRQTVKRAGEKWKNLQEKYSSLDEHLTEL